MLQFCNKSSLSCGMLQKNYIQLFYLVVLIFILHFLLVSVQGLKLCIYMYYCVASNETGLIHTLYFRDDCRYFCFQLS